MTEIKKQHGGSRTGSGRKKDYSRFRTSMKDVVTKSLKEIEEKGWQTPLEYMLSVMNLDPSEGKSVFERAKLASMKFEAAKAAAPYMHARLQSTEISGNMHVSHEQALIELDKESNDNDKRFQEKFEEEQKQIA